MWQNDAPSKSCCAKTPCSWSENWPVAGLVGGGSGSGYRFGKRLSIVLTFLKKTFFGKFFFSTWVGGRLCPKNCIHEEGGLFNSAIKPMLKGSPCPPEPGFL